MKSGSEHGELDEIDLGILAALQDNCRTSLSRIGERVDLSAPSVNERVRKLEEGGVIRGYSAQLDARQLGLDVTAFIGVSVRHPRQIEEIENSISGIDDVLECHHVTGEHSLLIKVKTQSTSTLEQLISRLRSIDGVERTETMVVLSTHTERSRVPIPTAAPRRGRRNGERRAASGS